MVNKNNKTLTFKDINLEYFLNDLKIINDELHKEFEILLILDCNNNNVIQKQQQQTKFINILKMYIDEINISQVIPNYSIKIQFARKYNFEHKKPLEF